MVSRALENGAAAVIAIVAVYFVWPEIETKYFPVVEYPAKIVQIDEAKDGQVFAWGTSRRIRACNFDHLRWYQGERGGRAVRVRVEFKEGNKVRGGGHFDWGPWLIYLDRDNLEKNSYADVWHQCRIFGVPLPWLTRSAFF